MKLEIYDSTLRDGAQGEGINFSVEDKINIVKKLDKLGIDYIEAGNPASNPKDIEFFQKINDIELKSSCLVAFGSTRKCGIDVEYDKGCNALLSANIDTIALFGKSSVEHVTNVLRTSLEENLRMISESINFFVSKGKTVFFDAEHFFDGYKIDPDYAMQTLLTAQKAGAERIILCDTNGAAFPDEIYTVTKIVTEKMQTKIGIHCHNDIGCAVANAMLAVKAGVVQIQGTYIGIGERCGNTNLATSIANLQLKLGHSCIPEECMNRLTKTARYIAEICNVHLSNTMPYVGKSAFAHKGGMHVDGVYKNSISFEHVPPQTVGNKRNVLLGEMSGRSALAGKISELDSSITRDSVEISKFSQLLKKLEHEGYEFESAGASLEILARKQLGQYRPAFELDNFKIIGEQSAINKDKCASAIVKVKVGNQIEMTAADGDGPIHALDVALRKALEVFYPQLSKMRLIDYKVRVIQTSNATAAKVRVLIESTDGQEVWTTVGVSTDIIDASWQALRDSIEYKLV